MAKDTIKPNSVSTLACQTAAGQTRIERPRRPSNTFTTAGEERKTTSKFQARKKPQALPWQRAPGSLTHKTAGRG